MWVLCSLIRCISKGEYSKWNVVFYLRVLGTMAKGGVRNKTHFFVVQTNKSHGLINQLQSGARASAAISCCAADPHPGDCRAEPPSHPPVTCWIREMGEDSFPLLLHILENSEEQGNPLS